MPPIDFNESELEEEEVAPPPSRKKAKRAPARNAIPDVEEFLSPDDDEDEDVIPARQAPVQAAETEIDMLEENGDGEAQVEEGEGDEDEDDEEPEGDEYVVEKIVTHLYDEVEKKWKYQVKWKGYEKLSDRTWEPEENLTNARAILEEYHQSIGGRPVHNPASGKKRGRGRPSLGTPGTGGKAAKARKLYHADVASKTSTPATEDHDSKWQPPSGTWEDSVQAVDTIEKNKDGKLYVLLQWNDGKKTRHPIEYTYKFCPQRMLHFYEQHLVFKEGGGKMAKADQRTEQELIENEDEAMKDDDK